MPNERQTSNDEAQFSRSTLGGKKNSWVKGRVSDELKLDLAQLCHRLDKSESEFIEQLLAARLYGLNHVKSVQQQKLDEVVNGGPVGGREGAA
jgi:hypothetical protein